MKKILAIVFISIFVFHCQLRAQLKEGPVFFEAPYEVNYNSLYVSALLNGRLKTFLFDTGAPTLVLDTLDMQDCGIKFSEDSNRVHVDSFSWNGIKWEDFKAAVAVGVSRMGKDGHYGWVGLLGCEIYKNYEIIYDLPHHHLQFMLTDSLGNVVRPLAVKGKPISVVPFTLLQHVPVFEMKIGEKIYHIILDSGAGINGLAPTAIDGLADTAYMDKDYTVSGRLKYTLKKGEDGMFWLKKATVGNSAFNNMLFKVTDSYFRKDEKDSPDGIVGYDFLKQHVITINYKKQQMCIY